MSEDRELLERAARAAGLQLKWGSYHDVGGIEVDCSDLASCIDNDGEEWPWDPLTDDGDALRLAVRLGISIVHRRTFADDALVAVAAARWSDDYDATETMYGNDKDAATRLAIVRAAASLCPSEDKRNTQ